MIPDMITYQLKDIAKNTHDIITDKLTRGIPDLNTEFKKKMEVWKEDVYKLDNVYIKYFVENDTENGYLKISKDGTNDALKNWVNSEWRYLGYLMDKPTIMDIKHALLQESFLTDYVTLLNLIISYKDKDSTNSGSLFPLEYFEQFVKMCSDETIVMGKIFSDLYSDLHDFRNICISNNSLDIDTNDSIKLQFNTIKARVFMANQLCQTVLNVDLVGGSSFKTPFDPRVVNTAAQCILDINTIINKDIAVADSVYIETKRVQYVELNETIINMFMFMNGVAPFELNDKAKIFLCARSVIQDFLELKKTSTNAPDHRLLKAFNERIYHLLMITIKSCSEYANMPLLYECYKISIAYIDSLLIATYKNRYSDLDEATKMKFIFSGSMEYLQQTVDKKPKMSTGSVNPCTFLGWKSRLENEGGGGENANSLDYLMDMYTDKLDKAASVYELLLLSYAQETDNRDKYGYVIDKALYTSKNMIVPSIESLLYYNSSAIKTMLNLVNKNGIHSEFKLLSYLAKLIKEPKNDELMKMYAILEQYNIDIVGFDDDVVDKFFRDDDDNHYTVSRDKIHPIYDNPEEIVENIRKELVRQRILGSYD